MTNSGIPKADNDRICVSSDGVRVDRSSGIILGVTLHLLCFVNGLKEFRSPTHLSSVTVGKAVSMSGLLPTCN